MPNLGSESMTQYSNILDHAFYSGLPIYNVQRQCTEDSTFSVVQIVSFGKNKDNNKVLNTILLSHGGLRNLKDKLLAKVRRPTRGVRTVATTRSTTGGKLLVVFDAECRQPIYINSERFNNEIGFIVRNHDTFAYKEWRVVPPEESFDISLGNETTLKSIDEQMRKAWKDHKYKLHNYFKDIGGLEDVELAKSKPHPDLNEEQLPNWDMLCDHWSSEKFQEWSAKNTETRSKRKWGSKNGFVSTQRHHIRRGEPLTVTTGQIETWRETHYDPEKGWITPDLESVYERMMALRAKQPPDVLSNLHIMERILRRHSVRLSGWGRSTSSSTATSDFGGPRRLTYDKLVERLNNTQQQLHEVVEGLNKCRQVLRQHNLMPPLKPHTTISNQSSGPATRIPPPDQQTSEHQDDS